MKRDDFINKDIRIGRKRAVETVPRKRSLAGMGEKEAALSDDIIASLDTNCWVVPEPIDMEKLSVRYGGNTYKVKIISSIPGVINIMAEADVWHEPTWLMRDK